MLGWVVVAGVIVRFFTRARDRGRNRFWWVSIGVASYMAPYILVHNVIGVWISSTFGIRYDGETLYFALLALIFGYPIPLILAVLIDLGSVGHGYRSRRR